MKRRDYIGVALGDAFAQLGQAYGQKMKWDRAGEIQQDLLSRTDQVQFPTTVEERLQGPETRSGEYPKALWPSYDTATVPRPLLDQRNLPDLERLRQLDPQTLQLLAQTFRENQPTQFNLGEGQTRFEQQPFNGPIKPVAMGFPPTSAADEIWAVELDAQGNPKTYNVPGTDDVRIWEKRTSGGVDTGQRRLATGGSPPSAFSDPTYRRGLDRERVMRGWQTRFTADPTVTELGRKEEAIREVRNLLNFAKVGNELAPGALSYAIAKMRDTGRLSDQDVEMASGVTSYSAQLENWASKKIGGVVAPDIIKDIEAVVDATEKGTQHTLRRKRSDYARKGFQAAPFISSQEWGDFFGVGSEGGGQPPPGADEFQVGTTYEDASGAKAIYRGNGKWEEVK